MSYTLAAGNNLGNLSVVVAETVDSNTMLTGKVDVAGDEYVFSDRVDSTFTTTALTRDYVAGEIVDVITDIENPTTPPSVTEYSFVFSTTTAVSSVPLSLNNMVIGSKYLITLRGEVLHTGTAATADIDFPPVEYFGEATELLVRVRAEGYLPFEVPAIVSFNGSSTFVAQVEDTIASPATVTGWTIDYVNKTLAHTSGTDIFTVNEFYSWLQSVFIDQLGSTVPMRAETPTIYTLINNWSIPNDADFAFLKGGSIIVLASGVEKDVWASLYSVGSIINTSTIYIIQNGAEVTKFWGADHIDILVKTKSNFTAIDSGNLRVMCRDYGNTFDHYDLTALIPGRYVIPLSNQLDANNTTAIGTVSAYTITLQTNNVIDRTIDADDTPGTYTFGLLADGATVQQLYEFGKFITSYTSTVLILGADGKMFVSALKSAPIGTIAGGVVSFAQGIFVEGVAIADTLKYILTDNGGILHQAAPPPVSIYVGSIVSGSTVYIYDNSNVIELYNAVVNDTSLTYVYGGGTGKSITVKVRHKNYKSFETTGTTSAAGLSVTAAQEADPVTAVYPVGIATDWTINTTTSRIGHVSGATVYTVRQWHSWLIETMSTPAYMQFSIPIQALTNYEFVMRNSWMVQADTDTQYLQTGSIYCPSQSKLFANLITLGTTSTELIYIYQDGVKLTGWWGAGNIDILVKVMDTTLIDSGILDIYTRDFNAVFDHSTVILTEGGRNYAALTTGPDTNNETAISTVATYNDITLTEVATSQDIGDGTGPQNYYGTIDCAGRTKEQVYEYLKYITRNGSVFSITGLPGQQFYKIAPGYDEKKNGPLAEMIGDLLVAQGWWIENIAPSSVLFYMVIDVNGIGHRVPVGDPSITITNVVAGSRIQVYDLTNSVELYNQIVSGSTFTVTKPYTVDLDLRVRLMHQSGVTAKVFYETQGTFASSGMSTRAAQANDTVYNTNNINGELVSGVAINDGLLLVSVSTGSISWQELYAYETYWLATEEGIRDEGRFAVAPDVANYRWYDFKLKNTTFPSVPLIVTGGYGVDGATGKSLDMIDTSGGTIIMAPDHVVPYAAGAEATVAIVQSGLTAQGFTTGRAPKLDNLDAAVSTASAPTPAQNATAVRAELGTELARIDTPTSSRLATIDYTIPDNAGIAAIPTTPLLAADARLDNLDAAISSRLATTGYTAPANADVAAIKAKTDTLVNAPTAADTAAAVLAASDVTPIAANVKKMNDAAVVGDGSEADKWRGSGV